MSRSRSGPGRWLRWLGTGAWIATSSLLVAELVLRGMTGVNDVWNLDDVPPDLLAPLGFARSILPELRLAGCCTSGGRQAPERARLGVNPFPCPLPPP
jgi:hypothetical protein